MTDFHIKRAADPDIPGILSLLSQVLELHAKIRPDIFVPGTTKYSSGELAEMLKDDLKPVYVAAGAGEQVLGYAFCQVRQPAFTSTMIPFTSLFIDDFCVDGQVRGQHIGRELFAYVKEEARRLGCREVTLNVWEGNDAAIGFYRAMGFRPKETQMEYIL